MKKFKIGIIGVGSISNCHIDSYLGNDRVELYAFCDIDEEQLKKQGEKYHVERLYTDLEEFLKLEEMDAVSVCVWNSNHAACTIAALKAGKHVLCEKPMAVSVEEAVMMRQAAETYQKTLMIGFVRRFGRDCAMLKDLIASDNFGEIYYAKASYLRRNGNPVGWFGDKKRSGGGPLIDLGVHVIDLTRYLLGNPKPVSVYGVTFRKLLDRKQLKDKKAYVSVSSTSEDVCDVEDLAAAMIRFDNGAVLSVETSFSLNIKKNVGKLELFGTKAGAVLNPELELFTETNGYLSNVSFDAKTSLELKDMFQNEIDHFISCIAGEADCVTPKEDGVDMMRILEAVYESARTGHEVVLS